MFTKETEGKCLISWSGQNTNFAEHSITSCILLANPQQALELPAFSRPFQTTVH